MTVLVFGLGLVGLSAMLSSAEAAGVSSGSFDLRPGVSGSADLKQSYAHGMSSVRFVVPGRPMGRGLYVGLETRASGGDSYRTKVRVDSEGRLWLGVTRVRRGREVALSTIAVPGNVTGRQSVYIDTAVGGDSSYALIKARTWVGGSSRPGWQLNLDDTDPAAVTTAGSTRAWSYVSNTATRLKVDFDQLRAVPGGSTHPQIPTPPPARPPIDPVEPPPAGEPGPGNTGVPEGTPLRVHFGDLTVTKAGTVIDGLDVRGFVNVKAPDVTIKNSIVRGRDASHSIGLITNTTSSATNLLVKDTELAPAKPSVFIDGLKGSNFTARRVNIHRTVDAVKVHGNNVRVESSWLHDLTRFAHDPHQGGGPTHNDVVQVLGGKNLAFVGNTMVATAKDNAGMQVTQDYSRVNDLRFRDNHVTGGTCSVKLHDKGSFGTGVVTVADNVFGGSNGISGCALLATPRVNLRDSGNTWSNGDPVVKKIFG